MIAKSHTAKRNRWNPPKRWDKPLFSTGDFATIHSRTLISESSHPEIDGKVDHHWTSLLFHLFGDYYKCSCKAINQRINAISISISMRYIFHQSLLGSLLQSVCRTLFTHCSICLDWTSVFVYFCTNKLKSSVWYRFFWSISNKKLTLLSSCTWHLPSYFLKQPGRFVVWTTGHDVVIHTFHLPWNGANQGPETLQMMSIFSIHHPISGYPLVN